MGSTSAAFSGANRGAQLGQNFGTISNTFVQKLAVPETSPPPTHTLPFRRDRDFIDRKDLIYEIQKKCNEPASRVALVGFGGVGKSQLAIEHAYRLRDLEPQIWTFWVHAGTTTRFEEGYRAIAEAVKIPDRNDPKVDILQLVKNWLLDRTKGKWLMILDNADDISVLFETQEKSRKSPSQDGESKTSSVMSRYLPVSENGSILITTRYEDAAFRLSGHKDDIISVEPMSEDQSLALFGKKLGINNDENAALDLVREVGMVPLAITQAALYIQQRQPRYLVRDYVKQLRRDARNQMRLLRRDMGDSQRDPGASSSAIKTLYMSFDYIRKRHPSAAELLGLMSCFDRQGIPASLLYRKCLVESNDRISDSRNGGQCGDTSSNVRHDMEFEDDIETLKQFSLVKMNVTGDTFEMHRLVQLAARNWLKTKHGRERCKIAFVRRLNTAFPHPHLVNWATCRLLFAHAEAAMEQKPRSKTVLLHWADLLRRAGWYASDSGMYMRAEKIMRKVVREQELLLGTGNPTVLKSVNLLGWILYRKGEHSQAEKLYWRAIDGLGAVCGSADPTRLNSIVKMAEVKLFDGFWNEAETLMSYVLEMHSRKPVLTDCSTLHCRKFRAEVYLVQGRLEQAERLCVEVVEAYERSIGSDHPNTINSLALLAFIHRRQGRLEGAEELCMQVAEARKRILGSENPDTLVTLGELALVYQDQGRLEEAEKLAIHVRRSMTRVLGSEHIDTLVTLSTIAHIYFKNGQLEKAERHRRDLLQLSERVMGPQHPKVLSDMHQLAMIWKAQGRHQKAVALMCDVVEKSIKVRGSEHPHTRENIELLNEYREALEDECQEVNATHRVK